MNRYENRMQLALALVVGLLLLANLFTLTLVALTPAARVERAPILFTVFVITLVVSVPSILLLPRWLLRPYRQLVDEAERAPVNSSERAEGRDETAFVLETFQEVVSQLNAKQRELERLTALASQRAQTAEQFNERIVASVPSGLVAFDKTGHATIVNEPARILLGCNGEVEGVEIHKLLGTSPELIAMVQRCLETAEVYRREEVKTTPAGGRARRLGVTVAPIDPQPGQGARGALCLLTDITEVVHLRETVALKRNLESLGEMSAGLAHEFKNSLAALNGYAQLLQTGSLDEKARAASADELVQEVRNLSDMVTSFLSFARPRPLEVSDVSLQELLNHCATDLHKLYEEKNIALAIGGEFPEINADERMLRQTMLNLLRNAAESISDASSYRRVTVTGYRESDDKKNTWAIVEINDTGGGIAEEDLHRIFIPFFTTKSKGHGVGLALAHRVITAHGGTLAATNSADGGAIFIIRLPALTQTG